MPRHRKRELAALIAAALSGAAQAEGAAESAPAARSLALPITFERNDGQFPSEVIFASRGRHGTLTVRAGEIAIAPRGEAGNPVEPLRLRMIGANPAPEVHAANALETRSHYYIRSEPVENVPHFGELQMRDVYPGIDVALHGRDGSLEYDFVVAAGADPRDIRIDLRGVERASLDAQGNLQYEHAGQVLTQHAPVAYQVDGMQREPVDAHFEIVEGPEGPEARIALGSYDTHAPLTVDPVISYSTFVGGSGTSGMKIKVDAAGHIYYAYRGSGFSMVLNRLNPATNTLVYQTQFGGSGTTDVWAMALGGTGGNTVYMVGNTTSSNFPVAASTSGQEGFVAAFTPAGTLAGGVHIAGVGGSGNGDDYATAVALDGAGNVYVGGHTYSSNFPVTGGQVPVGNGFGTSRSGFIAKFTGSFSPVYRRLLGGSGDDAIYGIAVDTAGQVIVVGSTASSDFPVANASSPTSPAPFGGANRAFAAKFTPDGMSPVYSQFIGGESALATAVAIDPTTGDAIVAGYTSSASFVPPSPRPFGGSNDGFVVRLSPAGTPTFGTLIGGSVSDHITDVAVSGAGDIYVTGATNSTNFPTVNPLSGFSVPRSLHEGFVARLRGGALDFSTYLGGTSNDFLMSVVPVTGGAVYVGGMTQSFDYPVVSAFRSTRADPNEGFITKITGLPPDPPQTNLAVTQAATRRSDAAGWDIVYEITVSNSSTLAAANVVVSDVLPAGAPYIWASPGCTLAVTTVTCSLGTLAAGATSKVKVVARPGVVGTATNTARAATSTLDANAADNTSTLSVPVTATPPATAIPRYRLFSDVTKEHHFTTDLNEYTVLGGNGAWTQEGTVGKVLNNPGSFNGVTAVPYYRLYDTSTRWHHWTTDANEYYTLSQYSWWNGEGVDGYILPTNTTGATQLFRLTYPFLPGLHHWTIDPVEYNALIASFGWIGEPGAGYVIQ